MKLSTTITAIATLILVNLSAQTGPTQEVVTLTVNGNAMPQPVSVNIQFAAHGTGAFDEFDSLAPVLPHHSGNSSSSDSLHPNAPVMNYVVPFTVSDDYNNIDRYDSRGVIDRYTSIPFGIAAFFADTVTIHASVFTSSTFANLTYNEEIGKIYIEDLLTGQFYQVLNNTVTLVIPSNMSFSPNYVIHVLPKTNSVSTPVTCFGGNNGSISIHNPNCTNWSYTIYYNGTPVNTSTVMNADTTLNNLQSEFYSVAVRTNNMLADSGLINVQSPAQIIPHFTPDNYSVYVNDAVSFTNESTGSVSYNWSFGDNTTDTDENPMHNFNTAGHFPVTLTAMNTNGCTETFTDTVIVEIVPPSAGFGPSFSHSSASHANNTNSARQQNEASVYSNGKNITIDQHSEGQSANIEITNLNGQLISSVSVTDNTNVFQVTENGIYIVKIAYSNGEVITKKILIN